MGGRAAPRVFILMMMTRLARLTRPLAARAAAKPTALHRLAVRALATNTTSPFKRSQSTAAIPEDEEAEWEHAWLEATEEVYDSTRTFEDTRG